MSAFRLGHSRKLVCLQCGQTIDGKAEFCPYCGADLAEAKLIQEGKARAKVLRSTDKWYGVTYQADKPVVVAAIAEKTAGGVYPDNLWEEKE